MGFQSRGVKMEGAGGVYPPAVIFQITDACRRVLAHFSDKNQHIDACIYACKLWWSPKPSWFLTPCNWRCWKKRHEAPKKLQNNSLYIVLVDNLLLTSLDLVTLSRFQIGWSKIMGYPYPLQKKYFSAVLYESQELSWKQVGGSTPPPPPVASPMFES
jgi:hypothetical protein